MTTVPITGAPGFRFFKDLYPTGRQGGLSYYPYSSINNGLALSWSLASGAPAAAPGAVNVTVSAGTAYLDSQMATLAANATINVAPAASAVLMGENIRRVYMNPTRALIPLPMGASAPTVLLNGDPVSAGDIVADAIDFGEYFGATGFRKYDGVAWLPFDPSFEAPALPAQSGKNRTWGGENHPKLAAGNLTVNQVEKRIYIQNLYPPYTSSNSKALLRDSASLELGTAVLYYYVLPMAVTAEFTNGNAAVTIAAEDRAMFADLVASIGAANTNALKLDSAAVTASGYNAGTGVLTLAANYAGTSGVKTVLLTPATPGNNYVLSPARSSLAGSGNLVNP